MKFLLLLEQILSKIELAFLVISLIVMVILSFLQVVLRNIFSSGLLWADTFLRYLVVWVGFIGASIATAEERHISIEALTKFIPNKFKVLSSFITHLVAAITCYFLLKATLQFIEIGLPADVKLFNSIPIIYFFSIVPIGFLLMLFHFLIRAFFKANSFFKMLTKEGKA